MHARDDIKAYCHGSYCSAAAAAATALGGITFFLNFLKKTKFEEMNFLKFSLFIIIKENDYFRKRFWEIICSERTLTALCGRRTWFWTFFLRNTDTRHSLNFL